VTEGFYHTVEADSFMQEPSSVCALWVWMCLYISTYSDSPEMTVYIPSNCQVILKSAQCGVTNV